MLKKLLLAIAIILPTCAFAQAKFGIVDAQSVMELMPEFKAAQEQLASVSKQYEDEYAKLTEAINKQIQEFQALAEDTPTAIRERRQHEIQDLDQRLQAFQQTAQQDLARKQQELVAPIQEKLVNAIKAVGSEKGFTMIYPDGVAIYVGNDVVDVTPDVKTKLGI
ncbi:MAG: OmpH family outer membrane protein [Bacteroides sp.]|nr:OmpH family outer membrane protein [Bacteroidales bacterium]MBD5325625.1 OmpH family outer membrane protein [Bacteroides sp.]MDE6223042.1 OmpH family outer membrane protein [Muribaculaceae bacterium]MBD5187536.1 OmpH family outer membrane protein [Bacteroidales bacterium]MBD5326999.1 OmpH family outer membrane protein [Bacteroides sp.]